MSNSSEKTPKKVLLNNSIIAVLNIVSFLLSISILVTGIWLFRQSSSQCERFLQKPMISIGVFLVVLSITGIIASCCRLSWLLYFYLLLTFLLILLLFSYTVFAFVVTSKGAGKPVPKRGYEEYRLEDYSNWIQKRVHTTRSWTKIKNCLAKSKICPSFIKDKNGTEVDNLYKEDLSPIESGCCIPPEVCNFTYSELLPKNWTRTAGSNLTDPDCTAWGNEMNVRCYNCQSCKAGMVGTIKSDWKKVAIINIFLLVFLVIVYYICCYAFWKNRKDNSSKDNSPKDP